MIPGTRNSSKPARARAVRSGNEGKIKIDANQLLDMLLGNPINANIGEKIFLPFINLVLKNYRSFVESNPELQERTLDEMIRFANTIQLAVKNNCILLTSM